MISNKKIRILDQPSYWVEHINGLVYDAIVTYMETHNMNQTDLAKHFGISKGRVSQILNDGNINFSIEKLVDILLKVDKFPELNLIDKHEMSINESRSDASVVTLSVPDKLNF